MPHSLKCKIKHLCHNGTITESERDRILKALDQEEMCNVLDKIRDEITECATYLYFECGGSQKIVELEDVLEIIDKYTEGIHGFDH